MKSLESRHLSQVEVLASWTLLSQKVPGAQSLPSPFTLSSPDLTSHAHQGSSCGWIPLAPTAHHPSCQQQRLPALLFVATDASLQSTRPQAPALSHPDCTVQTIFTVLNLCTDTCGSWRHGSCCSSKNTSLVHSTHVLIPRCL